MKNLSDASPPPQALGVQVMTHLLPWEYKCISSCRIVQIISTTRTKAIISLFPYLIRSWSKGGQFTEECEARNLQPPRWSQPLNRSLCPGCATFRGQKNLNFLDGNFQRAKTFRTKCVYRCRDKKARKSFPPQKKYM